MQGPGCQSRSNVHYLLHPMMIYDFLASPGSVSSQPAYAANMQDPIVRLTWRKRLGHLTQPGLICLFILVGKSAVTSHTYVLIKRAITHRTEILHADQNSGILTTEWFSYFMYSYVYPSTSYWPGQKEARQSLSFTPLLTHRLAAEVHRTLPRKTDKRYYTIL